MNNNSANLKRVLISEFRAQSIETFECRHCDEETKSFDEKLIAAQLCKSCLIKRKEYRDKYPFHSKSKPSDYDSKAENHITGDPFGENRHYISVECACCKNTYHLAPQGFDYPSIEKQKEHYDFTFAFHKGKNKFSPKTISYDYAPSGWENKILCKVCFDDFLSRNEEKIRRLDQSDEESRKLKDIEQKSEAEKQARLDDANDFSVRGWMVIAAIFVIVFLLKTCDMDIDDSELPYYRN
jgi:hypothetical protein